MAYLVGGPRRSGAKGAMCGGAGKTLPWEPTFPFLGVISPIHLGLKTFVFHGFWGPKVVIRDEISYLLERFEQMGFGQMVKRLH